MVSERWFSEAAGTSTDPDERGILNVLAAEEERRCERVRHPPLAARLAARVLAAPLDRALIGGADPASSPSLAARAALLTSRASRAELADGLDALLIGAEHPAGHTRVPAPRRPVLANAARLRELAGVLRGPAPVSAGGVARVRRLLTDGTGPVYTSRDGIVLERELSKARASVTC